MTRNLASTAFVAAVLGFGAAHSQAAPITYTFVGNALSGIVTPGSGTAFTNARFTLMVTADTDDVVGERSETGSYRQILVAGLDAVYALTDAGDALIAGGSFVPGRWGLFSTEEAVGFGNIGDDGESVGSMFRLTTGVRHDLALGLDELLGGALEVLPAQLAGSMLKFDKSDDATGSFRAQVSAVVTDPAAGVPEPASLLLLAGGLAALGASVRRSRDGS